MYIYIYTGYLAPGLGAGASRVTGPGRAAPKTWRKEECNSTDDSGTNEALGFGFRA